MSRVFIIAEAGVNHNGDLALARRLVDAAADAGADAVKFQTFKADRLASSAAPRAEYQKENSNDAGQDQLSMLRKLELDRAAHLELIARCKERGIEFLSTPFDHESITLLEELGVARYKIPSGEVDNLPYLRRIASLGKPVILSTGMCRLEDVRAAVNALTAAGQDPQAGDQAVKGMDREPAKLLDQAGELIQKAAAATADKAAERARNATVMSLAVMLIVCAAAHQLRSALQPHRDPAAGPRGAGVPGRGWG